MQKVSEGRGLRGRALSTFIDALKHRDAPRMAKPLLLREHVWAFVALAVAGHTPGARRMPAVTGCSFAVLLAREVR